MVLNLILAISIPLSLTIMGFFYYKTILLFVKSEDDKQKIKPPIEENTEQVNILSAEILNEYLNGKEE